MATASSDSYALLLLTPLLFLLHVVLFRLLHRAPLPIDDSTPINKYSTDSALQQKCSHKTMINAQSWTKTKEGR